MNLLIIKLGAMGDVLRTTSILKVLRQKYDIYWLTKPESADLLKDNPYLTKVVLLPEMESLSKVRFELVINLDEDKGVCRFVQGQRPKMILGTYLKDNRIAYTPSDWFDMSLVSRFGKERADELKKLNKKTYQEHISHMLGIEAGEYVFSLTKKEQMQSEQLIETWRLKKPVIGLNTGAGSRWRSKSLDIQKTVLLVDTLKKYNGSLLLLGGPDEKERNAELLGRCPGLIHTGTDNSIRDFACIVNCCDILITSDSLAMHLGIALKKYVIAFFGPTSPAEIELYGRGTKVFSDYSCAVCYKKECSSDPYPGAVEQIVDAVGQYLK